MSTQQVSPSQVKTRRRALGRKMAKNASDLRVIVEGIRNSPDFQFLMAEELRPVEKQLDAIATIAGNFDKLCERLENK